MTSNTMMGWSVALVLLLGGVYFLVQNNAKDSMMGDADNTMVTSSDAMMEQSDAMMASTSDSMMKDDKKGDAMMDDGDSMMSKGTYEAYASEKLAKANSGSVVLFFRASWCPSCKSVDADIRAHISAIPSNLTILDVDYDNSTALKQKYGVTYQHTFVQVKADGTLIKKWSGSPTLISLVAEVQ